MRPQVDVTALNGPHTVSVDALVELPGWQSYASAAEIEAELASLLDRSEALWGGANGPTATLCVSRARNQLAQVSVPSDALVGLEWTFPEPVPVALVLEGEGGRVIAEEVHWIPSRLAASPNNGSCALVISLPPSAEKTLTARFALGDKAVCAVKRAVVRFPDDPADGKVRFAIVPRVEGP